MEIWAQHDPQKSIFLQKVLSEAELLQLTIGQTGESVVVKLLLKFLMRAQILAR